MKPSVPITNCLLRHYYVGPAREYLITMSPDFFLIGELRISELDIRLMEGHEREFVSLLSVKLKNTLAEMAEELWAPTLPVHDEPMPESLYRRVARGAAP